MRFADKLKEFLNIQDYDYDYYDYDYYEYEEQETENYYKNEFYDDYKANEEIQETLISIDKQNKEKKKMQKKEQFIEKTKNKITKLYDALVKIKQDLENKKLSPFKRMLLQLKLDLIETRLDRQFAILDLEEFKDKMAELKDIYAEKHSKELDVAKEQYEDILEEKFDTERDIENLLSNREKQKQDGNNIDNEDKQKIQVKANTRIPLDIMEELAAKQNQLAEITDRQESKEEEILNLKEEFQEIQDRIKNVTNNKLIKYNPVMMAWGTVRTFFARAGKTISNWFVTSKYEREEKRQAIEKAKEDFSSKTRERTAQIMSEDNQKTVDRFKKRMDNEILPKEEIKEKDKEKRDVASVEEVTTEEQDKTADDLINELVTKIQKREPTDGLTTKIVDKIKEESLSEFKNNLNAKISLEDQNKFAKEIQQNDSVQNEEEKEQEEENDSIEYDSNRAGQIQRHAKYEFAIRQHENKLKKLEQQLQESDNQEEIEELKQYIQEEKEDIEVFRTRANDIQEMLDGKTEENKPQTGIERLQELKQNEEIKEQYKDLIDSSTNKETMEEILIKGEKIRQKKIKEQEEKQEDDER